MDSCAGRLLEASQALEMWAGTPGTVGGAIHGNAHFKGRLIGDLVETVEIVTPDGAVESVARADMEFGVRPEPSAADERGGPVRGLSLRGRGPNDAPRRRHATRWLIASGRSRSRSPSAGCIFQNPDRRLDRVPDGIPASAGALVDRAGLKGLREGGARVSPTHGNFIVNDGQATAERDPPAHRTVSNGCTGAVRRRAAGRNRLSGVLMATLRVEGGRPLSGRISVEGNKNAALAADCRMPADARAVRAVERSAHPRRRRAAGSADRSWRDGRRTRHVDAPDCVRARRERRAGSGAGRQAARVGAAARAAAGALRLGAVWRPPGGDFPGAAHDRHAPRGASRDGAESAGRAGSRAARARMV